MEILLGSERLEGERGLDFGHEVALSPDVVATRFLEITARLGDLGQAEVDTLRAEPHRKVWDSGDPNVQSRG